MLCITKWIQKLVCFSFLSFTLSGILETLLGVVKCLDKIVVQNPSPQQKNAAKGDKVVRNFMDIPRYRSELTPKGEKLRNGKSVSLRNWMYAAMYVFSPSSLILLVPSLQSPYVLR